MTEAERKTRALCAEIAPVDAGRARAVRERLPAELGRLRELAAQMAAGQRQETPSANLKGMALFAADSVSVQDAGARVKQFLQRRGPAEVVAQQFDVRTAVVDVGMREDFSQGEFAKQVLRQRWAVERCTPMESAWESVQAGIRTAYMMKGKGTDLFGLGLFSSNWDSALKFEHLAVCRAWDVGAACGFLLAAANLQTPVVVPGASAAWVAKLAMELAPAVQDYLIAAQRLEVVSVMQPLLDWQTDERLAVMMALGLCESAARAAR